MLGPLVQDKVSEIKLRRMYYYECQNDNDVVVMCVVCENLFESKVLLYQ